MYLVFVMYVVLASILSKFCDCMRIAKHTPSTAPRQPFDPLGSCPRNPRRPSVRLSWIQPIEVHGVPPITQSSPSGNFRLLRDPGAAFLNFILGADWQSRVQISPDIPPKGKYRYLPIPGNDDEEREHCRRMRQCGAILVTDMDEVRARAHDDGPESPWPQQDIEKYIFGWPDSGGVWVLAIPREIWKRNLPDSDAAYIRAIVEHEELYGGIEDTIRNLKQRLREEQDMDGVCEVLRTAGATFYSNVTDSPEILSLGLLDTSDFRDAMVPSTYSIGRWW